MRICCVGGTAGEFVMRARRRVLSWRRVKHWRRRPGGQHHHRHSARCIRPRRAAG